MRLATILDAGRATAALVRDDRVLPLAAVDPALRSVRAIAAAGGDALARIEAWATTQPEAAWQPLDGVAFGPAVPDPGAIYTIGHNYRVPGEPPGGGPERPLVYGKAAASVGAHGATLAWDRGVTDNVDAEVELGLVMGADGAVFGYTCMNDVSSRDAWLDGDQWLLGKSLPGFCPVGPWVVTAEELDPADLALRCAIDGAPIQDGRTSDMRFTIPEIVAWLRRHLELRPGDLIATGTPPRLASPPGPGRRVRPGDTVTVWIEGIGELTTRIA